MNVLLSGQKAILLQEKALWLSDYNTLAIADIHLGKARHFRKSGIAIPAQSQNSDFANLHSIINKYKPKKVLFLGDLFHSTYNNDWHLLKETLQHYYNSIQFILIKGNHDLIDAEAISSSGIECVTDYWLEQLHFTHEPLSNIANNTYNIAGHIHPGYTIHGKGKQSLRLPCFYMSDKQLILPSFGILTGLHIIEKKQHTDIYLVLPDSIHKL